MSLADINEQNILVARPNAIWNCYVNLDYVLGFACDIGGRTSHASIMARSWASAIVGTNDITKQVKNGDMLVLDAMNNKIIINPSDAELAEAKKIKSDFEAEATELAKLKTYQLSRLITIK